jgi:hypothetical protein
MVKATKLRGAEAPIFIVGVPRSGTTLLAAMLAAHSRLSCGPETHFFEKPITDSISRTLCDPDQWPHPAVDFLYSIYHCAKPVPDNHGISKEEIEHYLGQRCPSVATVLAALTELHMSHRAKKRWVEKTPIHGLRVQTIRHCFPRAPIIRIVRDPRDVTLSILKESWGAGSLVECICLWKLHEAVWTRFVKSDRHAFTLRYEDLISSPESMLKQVCEWIGEEFELDMLDTAQSIRDVNRVNEPWKAKAGTPIDSTRLGNWRHSLSDLENRTFEAMLGDDLLANGYPCRENFVGFARVYPFGESKGFWNQIEEFVSKGYRFWPKRRHETPAVSIYLNQPDGVGWLRGGSLSRLVEAAAISIDLCRSKVSGRPVHWFEIGNCKSSSGFCAQLVRLSRGFFCTPPVRIEQSSPCREQGGCAAGSTVNSTGDPWKLPS